MLAMLREVRQFLRERAHHDDRKTCSVPARMKKTKNVDECMKRHCKKMKGRGQAFLE